MNLVVTILGCGSSGGVPRVAQGWGACDPNNPRNRRRRCSILVERSGPAGATTLLVDTSPDLREQLIERAVVSLDGVIITHPHADHTHGIDDLRPFYILEGKPLDIYMDDKTSRVVRKAFSYIFDRPAWSSYPPLAKEFPLTANEAFRVEGPGGPVKATPFELEHGEISALGLRFGDLAYTPDVNAIPPRSEAFLEGLDVWIVDALRYRRHPSHFSLDEALAWIEKMRPRRAVLTNMHTDLDYEALRARLPENVVPAYDGMRIETGGG